MNDDLPFRYPPDQEKEWSGGWHPWTQQEAASIAVFWADALIARLAEMPSEQVAPGVSDPRD